MLRVLTLAVALGILPRPSGADLVEVEKRGTLRVLAVVVAGEPEFFADPPEPMPGFDREVLEGYARLRKLRVEVVRQASWDSLVPALLEGKGDLIGGRFTASDSRRKRIAFSSETFPTRNVVISRKPRGPIATEEELRAVKVGIVRGTSLVEVAGHLQLDKSLLDDQIPPGGVPEALRTGRVACAIEELAGAIILKQRDPDVQIGLFIGPPGSYAFGVRLEDKGLLASLNAYIENLRRTPTWNRLVVKYFGEQAPEVLKKARAE